MSEPKENDGLPLRIDYHVPDDFLGRYSTHLLVQHTEHEFILSFFEVYPPTLYKPTEQEVEMLRAQGTIRAKCVARVVVAADRMPVFVQALQENLKRYESKAAMKTEQESPE